jgi:23S rRNA (guanosine2251-2'-O)-methyltransferase
MKRRESKRQQLYGVGPVIEALRARRREIENITVAEGAHGTRLRELLSLAKENGVVVRRVPRAMLSRVAGESANHQGVIATIAAARYADRDDLLERLSRKIGTDEQPLVVALDCIEDPRNLGAIIRAVECAGAHGVFIPERRAVGLTEAVAKASAGAVEHVPVARVTNFARLIDDLKERNIWTICASANAETNYTDWDWTLSSAIVLGSEGAGLHRLVREKCDALVRIPILGHIESLNVSVAAGIILYEALRQRTIARSRS